MLLPFADRQLLKLVDDRIHLGDRLIVMTHPRLLLGLHGEPVLGE
jgi:hypothetical protein